jgi:predicted  nucleic acid-binding Zn-ribbon protein
LSFPRKNRLLKKILIERNDTKMRLLLADGTQVSVQTYSSTSALVSGNTLPALSIVVNESLDKVKTLFGDENNLVDFNIYEDDKNVVLLHAIGYQKRVGITLGESDDVCTVTLAKTSETDVILTQVLSALDTLEKQASANQETVSTLQESVKSITETISTTTDTLSTVNKNYEETKDAIDLVSKSVLELAQQQQIDRESVDSVSKSITEFQDTITGFTAAVEGFRQTAQAASEASANAATSLDDVNKAYTINDAKLTRISEESSNAVNFINENGKAVQEASQAIAGVAQNIEDLQKTVESNKSEAERLSKAFTTMNADFTPLKENVTNVMKSVNNQTKKINSVTDDILTVRKSVSNQDETIDAFKKEQQEALQSVSNTVNSVSRSVSSVSQDISNTNQKVEDVDKRVSDLEPVTDYTTLDLEAAKQFRITESQTALEEYLAAHPITSTCHGGVEASYSITKEKQTYLQSMISVASLAAQSGVPYQPSWNATGEVCSYDWTLEELTQLAMEIEAVVRPLVSYQQTLENQIKAVTSMEELSAITIDYNEAPVHVTEATDTTAEATDTVEPAESTEESTPVEETSEEQPETASEE